MDLIIENQFGTFRWSLPDYGGSASGLARIVFDHIGRPFEEPEMGSSDTGLGPTCPKCGSEAPAEWLPKGSMRDVVDGEPIERNGFAVLVGLQGRRFMTERECLRRDCDCGYSWLGPLTPGGPR